MTALIVKLWNRFHELIVYCLIGCTGATLDFVIYAMLTSTVGLHYQWANLISVSFGIVNNYFLNCCFNFKTRNHFLLRFMSFYCVGMLGWAMSAGCLWLLIEKIGTHALVAKLGTLLFVTVAQFCLNKFITFRKKENR